MRTRCWWPLGVVLLAAIIGCGDDGGTPIEEGCPSGLTDCTGVCVDTDYDPGNCGACANSCDTGMLCSLGSCDTECYGGSTQCGDVCADTSTDEVNCGGCGTICGDGEVCTDGACGFCEDGLTECGTSCIDTDADDNNCGGCDIVCGLGQACLSGSCTGVAPAVAFVTAGYRGAQGRDLYIGYDSDAPDNLQKINPVTFDSATVVSFTLLSNGHIVFLAAQNTEGVVELYLAPIGAGSLVKLSAALISGGNVTDYIISDDETRFVYRADGDTDDVMEIYIGQLSTAGTATKLNGALVPGGNVQAGYVLSKDNTTVAYRADETVVGTVDAYAVTVANPEVSTRVSDDTVATAVAQVALTNDGATVVYRAAEVSGLTELHAVTIASPSVRTSLDTLGGAVNILHVSNSRVIYSRELAGELSAQYVDIGTPDMPVQLSAVLPAPFEIKPDIHVLSDGSALVYRTPTGADNYARLVMVNVAQPGVETVISASDSTTSVQSFRVSRDDTTVAYPVTASGGGCKGCFISIPQDTSLHHVPLGDLASNVEFRLPTGESLEKYSISLNGSNVAYSSNEPTGTGVPTVFVVNPTTPTERTVLTPALMSYEAGPYSNHLAINPTSDKAYVLGDYDSDTVTEVYQLDSATPGTMVTVSAAQPNTGVSTFQVSPDGAWMAYLADEEAANRDELYLVNLTTPGVSTKLNPTLAAFGRVYSYVLRNDRVFFTADVAGDGTSELYTVAFASPGTATKLNAGLATGRQVTDFSPSEDGTVVAYRANQDALDVYGIFYVPVATPGMSTLLTPAGESGEYPKVSPNNSFVTYHRASELRMVTLAAPTVETSASGLLVSGGNVFSDYIISADSSFIVYRADGSTNNKNELYMIDLAAPGISIKLNDVFTNANSDVFEFKMTPDQTRVVYRADKNDSRNQLYVVELATPAVATLVHQDTGNDARDVFSYVVTDTGVVFRGDVVNSSRTELFLSEFATPGASIFLATMATFSDVDEIQSSGNHVYFRADMVAGGVSEIYHVDMSSPDEISTLTPYIGPSDVSHLAAF